MRCTTTSGPIWGTLPRPRTLPSSSLNAVPNRTLINTNRHRQTNSKLSSSNRWAHTAVNWHYRGSGGSCILFLKLKGFPTLPAGSEQWGCSQCYHVLLLLLSLTLLLEPLASRHWISPKMCHWGLNLLALISTVSYVSDPKIPCQWTLVAFLTGTRVCTTWRPLNYWQWGIFLLAGVCMGWNRIVLAVPVKPHEWSKAAALWDSHLREEEKEAEDGPCWPQPSRWEQSCRTMTEVISVWPSPSDLGFSLFEFLRFFCECIIWEIEYGRDWDCGGFLRDFSQTKLYWLIWTAAALPEPSMWPLDFAHDTHP